MGKEILTVHQTLHEKKMDWMEQAIQEGALSKLPPHTTQKQWEKQQDIGITYTFGDVTYDDLGKIHVCTKENIRQIDEKFVINLWKNSSPPLQAEYPLSEISLTKPLGQTSRERHSRAGGGISLKVRELLETGITDPKRVKDALRISTRQLGQVRIILRRWKVDVSRTYEPRRKRREIVEKIATEDDDSELQKLLDSFSTGSLRAFLQRDPKREMLTTVSAIAEDQGFHAHTRRIGLIAEKIKKAKIPIRQIVRLDKNGRMLGSSYIVCTKHAGRIAEVLSNDPDLQRFK